MTRTLVALQFAMLVCIASWPQSVEAHALAPILFEVDSSDGQMHQLIIRRSGRSTSGASLRIVLPDACELTRQWSTPKLAEQYIESQAGMRCPSSDLGGSRFGFTGLQGSGVVVLIRMRSGDSIRHEALLDREQASWVVPRAPVSNRIPAQYLKAGFEHLLIGLDHVLLVIALTLLVPGLRSLVATVTAFTVGHSISLSLSTLGWISLPQAPVEILIAASLVPLALELLKTKPSPWRARLPWLSVAIGLVHGLGFAGVLGDIGLPPNEQVSALLAFNVGIELAQLLLVFAVLGAEWLARQVPALAPAVLLRATPAYGIGSIACYWCMDRVQGLLV